MLKTTINTQIAFRFYESEINAHIETLKQEDLILIQSICSKIGIDYRYVFIKRRYRELVTARCIICHYLLDTVKEIKVNKKCKESIIKYSLVEIGVMLAPSTYDHTTMINLVKLHETLILYDTEYQSIFNLTNQPKQLRPCGMSLVKGDKF